MSWMIIRLNQYPKTAKILVGATLLADAKLNPQTTGSSVRFCKGA